MRKNDYYCRDISIVTVKSKGCARRCDAILSFKVLDDFWIPCVPRYFFSSFAIFFRSTRSFKVPGHGAIMIIFDGKKICI